MRIDFFLWFVWLQVEFSTRISSAHQVLKGSVSIHAHPLVLDEGAGNVCDFCTCRIREGAGFYTCKACASYQLCPGCFLAHHEDTSTSPKPSPSITIEGTA